MKLALSIGVFFYCASAVLSCAFGSSVSLVPTSNTENVTMGEIVTFEVVIDFSDITGGTLGGGFDILFDPDVLQVLQFTVSEVGDVEFRRFPNFNSGMLESAAIAGFNGIPDGVVAEIEFLVLPHAVLGTRVEITGTSGVGGPWVRGDDFVTIEVPDYNSVTISSAQGSHKDGFE